MTPYRLARALDKRIKDTVGAAGRALERLDAEQIRSDEQILRRIIPFYDDHVLYERERAEAERLIAEDRMAEAAELWAEYRERQHRAGEARARDRADDPDTVREREQLRAYAEGQRQRDPEMSAREIATRILETQREIPKRQRRTCRPDDERNAIEARAKRVRKALKTL